MGHESPPTLPVAKPGGLRGDTREPRGGHPHKGGRRDRREVRAIPVRVSFVDEGPGSCAHVRTIKSDPRRKFRGPYPSECYAGIWSSSTSAFTTEEAEGEPRDPARVFGGARSEPPLPEDTRDYYSM